MREDNQRLVEWKPVHIVGSAAVYAELREMRPAHENREARLAAFGDPLCKSHDWPNRGFAAPGATVPDAAGPRLRFSREEASAIAEIYGSSSQLYLRADATEERAKTLGANFRYIHFATHTQIDDRFPLDSALVFSVPENRREGAENGLLQVWEIFEQVRWEADLVALCACETALGPELRNEGLMGMTRALQYAGAHSILASLWSVEDRRTARLMQSFYTHLKDGATKDRRYERLNAI